MREAVLHHHIDRATQRIEAKHRIGAPHIHAGDGVLGDGVPVDGIAEGFVQPHPVLIDGQALRRALERGGVEAMEAQILKQAVALHIAQADPGSLRAERRQNRAAMLGGEIVGGKALQRAGDFVG